MPLPKHPPSPRQAALTQKHAALTQTRCPHQTPCPHPDMLPSPRHTRHMSCHSAFPGHHMCDCVHGFVWLNPSAFSLLAPEPRFLVTSPCPLVILTALGPGASAAPPPGRTGPVAHLSPP
ncbi:unnamed protein product [Rangifer tarandus platyrhynchus]|uniref:Uncharacterized protein n=2 Tax=Rangifer tarandus platyrhynchus TaxID=3082113 RepID=A0AC59ZY79_RANTA|nr:unnamed protein product [Rangifer tarandus platyrhynchus]